MATRTGINLSKLPRHLKKNRFVLADAIFQKSRQFHVNNGRTMNSEGSHPSPPRDFSCREGFRKIDLSQKVEEETLPQYLAGRYYPVHIGEIFKSREHRYLTLKVHVRSKRRLPEVAVVEHLRKTQNDHPGQKFVRLISDFFEITGPHDTHTCFLYPPAGLDRPNNILARVADSSILSILEQDELSSPSPRKIYEDGRPIYLSRPMFLTKGEPVLSDLGEACWGEGRHTGVIMPALYRAPEVILDMGWDSKVDIWGLGQTTLFEGSHLFRNTRRAGELDKTARFAEMTALLGPPPEEFRKRSHECLQYWDENGIWRGSVPIPDQLLESREQHLEGGEKVQFLTLIRKMLAWLPEERPTAENLLYDKWIRGDDYYVPSYYVSWQKLVELSIHSLRWRASKTLYLTVTKNHAKVSVPDNLISCLATARRMRTRLVSGSKFL
ncbi:hypothetical protein AJ80_07966 [Polytolypa hystricis UAMH7299]|uniref:Protein kinase domain-containing protein n=1 Tax=Polytolypa hystricis (strain UAMH7299) TaxID=1447883 RepID=A0A2B7XFY5_POLH7|nr:hypothetical protein AJ80_07966 [Polytolypa hystricis UAMH7299]